MNAFSDDIALADDIVAELNDRSWLLPFTAERTWIPEWTQRAGELETLQVSVNPWLDPSGTLTERDEEIWTVWPIDITFAQRITEQSREQVDQLAHLVEQVRQFLTPQRFQLEDLRIFEAWEFQYLARFDPSQLNRVPTATGTAYTGVFLSAFRVPYHKLP